jgi:hypothetical protein
MSHDYVRGDIVRHGDNWGVVRGYKFAGLPSIDWWVGQYKAGDVEQWYRQVGCAPVEISAPFAVDYAGIPEEVIARSMAIILTEDV